jgi:hypothetical protein
MATIGKLFTYMRDGLGRAPQENAMAVGILLSGHLPTLALGTSASQQAQLIGEATTLAKACRLPFNEKVAQAVIAQISQQLSPSAFYRERKYAEAYTHNDLRQNKVQICAKALIRFGSSGDRIRNMLRMR